MSIDLSFKNIEQLDSSLNLHNYVYSIHWQ